MTTSPLSLEEALDAAVGRLAAEPVGGYAGDAPPASEPTAWAAIALADAGRVDAAAAGADWLAGLQARDGSVGVTADDPTPGWTTALAMLAWDAVDPSRYADAIARGAAWAFEQDPWTQPYNPILGHDISLAGWSWAADTASWLEPTAFFAVALRRAGAVDHPRRLEAVRLIEDRILSGGGANYGNTVVFGQELLQHVQASGVAAWALAGESADQGRVGATLDYLAGVVAEPTGVASLCWAVRGLAAHRRREASLDALLSAAWPRVEASSGVYKPALFALAAQGLLAIDPAPFPLGARR